MIIVINIRPGLFNGRCTHSFIKFLFQYFTLLCFFEWI